MRTRSPGLTDNGSRDVPALFLIARKGCLFILILIGVSLLPCPVRASPVLLLDLLPKTINGENGAFLQSRTGSTYTDLEFLSNAGDYWFGTAGTPQAKPLITRGEFEPDKPRDPFSVYAFPSSVNQTGLKADAVIRWKLPGSGNRVQVNGSCLREGRNVFPLRFSIYIGPGNYENPLWETVNGGDFNLLLNYSAGDEIFFATECLAEDINIRGRWKNVTLETFPGGIPEGGASPGPAAQGIPLMYIAIFSAVLVVGVAVVAMRRYGMISGLREGGLGPLTATGTPQKEVITSAEGIPAAEGNGAPAARRVPSHHDVFICYSNPDKPVADAICAHLESHSIRCWIAPRDVLPGENFPESIIRAIEESRIMVLVFSSHANSSQHVLRELTKAVSKGIIIIPFRIEEVPLSRSMEYLIGLPHWLDAMTPPLERHIDTLVRTVDTLLTRT
jgi:TIR domain